LNDHQYAAREPVAHGERKRRAHTRSQPLQPRFGCFFSGGARRRRVVRGARRESRVEAGRFHVLEVWRLRDMPGMIWIKDPLKDPWGRAG